MHANQPHSTPASETFISIDVETAGPYPGKYALLSIGACTLEHLPATFYVELKPDSPHAIPEALAVCRLSLAELEERGVQPSQAMERFATWVAQQTPADRQPIFVAFNAAFDWCFVNEYFHRYLGYNPFGHAALDIKAFYMGLSGAAWIETTMDRVSPRYLQNQRLSHHALQDALDQAKIFARMLEERHSKFSKA